MKQIKTKEDLNMAMFNLAKNTAHIQQLEAFYQEKIDALIQQKEKKVSPLQNEKQDIEEYITNYVNANRENLFEGETKTLKTPYGSISFKFTKEKIEFESEDVVIHNIKSHWFKYLFNKSYRAAIKTEYKVVKEVIKQLNDVELASIGVTKSSEERMYIVPNLTALNKENC